MRIMPYFLHLASALPALAAITPLLLPAPATAQENRLGRLFHTPEERAKLDQKRGVVVAPVQTGPQTTIVNGIITRSGQAPILFIDGKESRGAASQASAQQQLSQGVPLRSEGGQTFAAKPGQIVDLASGKALEVYQLVPGAVEMAPPAGSATPAPSGITQPSIQPTVPDRARLPPSPR